MLWDKHKVRTSAYADCDGQRQKEGNSRSDTHGEEEGKRMYFVFYAFEMLINDGGWRNMKRCGGV